MEIKCPNCGQTCEVDEEPVQGQHLLCPFCDVKFNYTSQNTTENDSYSIANMAETNVEEPPAKIQAACPHCGATYEVDAAYIGETATCGTCNSPFVIKAVRGTQSPDAPGDAAAEKAAQTAPGATNGHIASKSGRIRINTLRTKAKSAVNTAKDTLIPVLKTAANKTKIKASPALKSAANAAKIKTVALWQSGKKDKFIISGIAVLLAISLAVPFLLPFSDDSNAVNPAINAAVPKNSRTNTTSENRAEKIKEAVQALRNYIETPTDRRLQAVSESLEHCPQDFSEAVKDLLISLNKTCNDMISEQERKDAEDGGLVLSFLFGALSDNPRDAMSSGFQIGHAIHSEMQQKAQKRLEQEIKYKLTDLIDIAQKYGVDLND